MDGNHKLVKWGFVIHVAIDGYRRLVTFAETSTNNEAITVLNHFLSALETFGWPLRGTVRTDHGVSLPLYKYTVNFIALIASIRLFHLM